MLSRPLRRNSQRLIGIRSRKHVTYERRITMSVLGDELRQKIVALLPRYPRKQAATLPALHLVQDVHRCVSFAAIREIAELLDLAPAEVYDTMTFYGFFREEDKPLGRTRLWFCRSLACALRGG